MAEDVGFEEKFNALMDKNFDDLFGGVDEVVAADQAAMSRKTSFGRCAVQPLYKVKIGKDGYQYVNREAYMAAAQSARILEVEVNVDIQDFSERAKSEGWSYVRKISTFGDEWKKFVESLITALVEYNPKEFEPQKAEVRKNALQFLKHIHGKYVEVNDVPRSKPAPDGKTYRSPVVEHIYHSREEAYAAYRERFKLDEVQENDTPIPPAAEPMASGITPPNGWKVSEWIDTIPALKLMKEGGSTPKEIADAYGVGVKHVVEALAQ